MAELAVAAAATLTRRPNGWLKARIHAALEEIEQPISGHQLALMLNREANFVHPSAVFRVLNQMLRDGSIRRAELVAGYLIRRRGAVLDLVCQDCGRVFERDGSEATALLANLAVSMGFTPLRFVIEVAGRCRDCARVTSVKGQDDLEGPVAPE